MELAEPPLSGASKPSRLDELFAWAAGRIRRPRVTSRVATGGQVKQVDPRDRNYNNRS